MREISVPAKVEATREGNLSDLVVQNAEQAPTTPVLARRVSGGWRDVTARAFSDEVRALAKGLVAAGVSPGDRVGIMSKTRYEWTLTDFAVWTAGGIVVPIYETSSAEQVAWILADSGAVAVVTETAAHSEAVASVRDRLPALKDVWQIEGGALDELATAGSGVSDQDLEARRRASGPADVATIIYTSGTTGRPKGCELTHANFADLASNAVASLNEVVSAEGASTLLFLPLAHVFARFIEVLCIAGRVKMAHSPDIKNLLDDLAGFRPTFILAVPRVFEKVYNSAEQKAEAASSSKGKIFRQAAEVAVAWSRAQDDAGPGLLLRLKHALFDRLVYGKLRTALGGQVQYAVSGGAPLGERLGHFYRGLGLIVLEGYGLTETTAPATVNTPERIKIGTVGRPLPGVAVRLGDDGELLVKGVNVLRGYWNNAQATAEALSDGWFHTGDLGEIDDDGFVRITGRKKEIIVTAAGKNVAPAVLEDRIRAHPLISQCMVVGDQKPFIAALITLDADMLPTWLANQGLENKPVAELVNDPAVLAEVQRAVDDANTQVSKAESIRKFTILPVDFSEEDGTMTPSLKLKRNVVLKEFGDAVDAIYA